MVYISVGYRLLFPSLSLSLSPYFEKINPFNGIEVDSIGFVVFIDTIHLIRFNHQASVQEKLTNTDLSMVTKIVNKKCKKLSK